MLNEKQAQELKEIYDIISYNYDEDFIGFLQMIENYEVKFANKYEMCCFVALYYIANENEEHLPINEDIIKKLCVKMQECNQKHTYEEYLQELRMRYIGNNDFCIDSFDFYIEYNCYYDIFTGQRHIDDDLFDFFEKCKSYFLTFDENLKLINNLKNDLYVTIYHHNNCFSKKIEKIQINLYYDEKLQDYNFYEELNLYITYRIVHNNFEYVYKRVVDNDDLNICHCDDDLFFERYIVLLQETGKYINMHINNINCFLSNMMITPYTKKRIEDIKNEKYY